MGVYEAIRLTCNPVQQVYVRKCSDHYFPAAEVWQYFRKEFTSEANMSPNAGTSLRFTVPSARHKDMPSEIALPMARRRPTQVETPPRVKTKMSSRSTRERIRVMTKMGNKA